MVIGRWQSENFAFRTLHERREDAGVILKVKLDLFIKSQ